MPKLTLQNIESLTNEQTFISRTNSNYTLIEDALENTLSRDGTTPNSMEADLDMDSNRIINLSEAISNTEPVRKAEFDSTIAGILNEGDGNIVGPDSSTDNAIAKFNGTSGQLLKNSVATISDTGVTSGLIFANTALKVQDTNASHSLVLTPGSDLSADRVLTITTGDANRTLDISAGNVTISSAGAALVDDASIAAQATTLGLGTGDSPQFAAVNIGHASDTTIARDSAGVISVEGVALYPNIPQNSRSAAYTTVLSDANKHILHPVADNNARTFTIDSNANVAYPIGTCITFINEINTVTIAITSDTLTLSGTGTTGSRTLAANGMATAIKITSTKWMISGSGLS